MHSPNQTLHLEVFKDVEVAIKREDLLHPILSGNKYRKLKYNVETARQQKKETLLSFGGAFSNHIAAVAGAGQEFGFKTIGIIRGEELKNKINQNSTLSYARECGMQFKFVSRAEYRDKNKSWFVEKLRKEFGHFYLIPEGGTNDLAIKGCEEILTEEDNKYNYISTPVGTSGTMVGLINSSQANQKVLGFSALKGDFLTEEIKRLQANKKNWSLITDYHFGGYGKINDELVTFINKFKQETTIPLDPIYTGKMLYGLVDLAKKNYFEKGSKILVIHTGGLQGVEGINKKLRKQNKQELV